MDPRENHKKQVSCLELHEPTLELAMRMNRKGLGGCPGEASIPILCPLSYP